MIYNMRASRVVFQDFWQGNVVFRLFFDWGSLLLGGSGGLPPLMRNPIVGLGLIAGRGTRGVRGCWGVPHGVVKLVGIDRMVPLTFYIIIWVTIKLATFI